jgi:hypothetical protein
MKKTPKQAVTKKKLKSPSFRIETEQDDKAKERRFKVRAEKLVLNYPPGNLARFGIERLAESFSTATDQQEKAWTQSEMESIAGLAKQHRSKMGPESIEIDLREQTIRRIEILKQRGMLAMEKDFRESAADDLASILDAALEALATLAVRCQDVGAIRYLAFRADLGQKRLPRDNYQSLKESIIGMGGECADAWIKTESERNWHGKRNKGKPLGVWAVLLWDSYRQFRIDLLNDAMNCRDVPTPQERWNSFLFEHRFPPAALPLTVNLTRLRINEFIENIAWPLLAWCANPESEVHKQLWAKLIGERYKSANGPDSHKIKKQMRLAIVNSEHYTPE